MNVSFYVATANQSFNLEARSDPQNESISIEDKFDKQFHKWQQAFGSWKKAKVNHPDKIAYRRYVQQYESIFQKLMKVLLQKLKST